MNLRVLAPLSWLALIIGAWLALMSFLTVLNLRLLAPPSWFALIIGAWLALVGVSTSCEFADVDSAVVSCFENRGLPCVHGYF